MERRKEDWADVLSPVRASGPIFWIDRPSKQEHIRPDSHCEDLESRLKEKEVPLYDRACILALSTQDSSDSQDQYLCIEPKECSRCFNCGSYSHSLNNCSRPRDMAAISSSRRILLEKRGSFRSGGTSRYYRCFRGVRSDDLKPGVLSPGTRKVLGTGVQDPSPGLNQMREDPSGYMEDSENESSGVKIIDEDTKTVSEDCETTVSPTYPADELKLWASPLDSEPRQPSRGAKRSFEQFSQSFSSVDATSGSPVLSPMYRLQVEALDACARDGSYLKSISSSHVRIWSDSRSCGIESFPGNRTSSVWNPNYANKMVADPAGHCFKGQFPGGKPCAVDGQGSVKIMSTVPDFQRPASSLSGVVLPEKSLSAPSIPHFNVSIHSESHLIQPHMFPVAGVHRPNEAWLKAQLALNALKPNQNFADLR